MLNLFHGWVQEVGPDVRRSRTSTGLYVGPSNTSRQPARLTQAASYQIVNIIASRRGRCGEFRTWLASLPSTCRNTLIECVYDYSPDPDNISLLPSSVPTQFTRSAYFHILGWSWSILFGADWSQVQIPDLYSLLLNRKDISIDSPSREEDVARVLSRLGLHTFKFKERLSDCHMTHSDLYTLIFKTIADTGQSQVKKLILKQYLNRNVQSIREMQGIFNMIAQMPRLVHIEIGYAANDAILWQIARNCNFLRVLMISGNDVTDKGLFWLCGLNWELREDEIYLNPDNAETFLYQESEQTKSCEDLSAEDNPDGQENYLHFKNRIEYRIPEYLIHLNISGALHVTELGVKQCWSTFRNLRQLNIQESHLWSILADVQISELYTQFILPIRSIELTTSSRHNYLSGAAKLFPALEDLTIWNFDSEYSSPLQEFTEWESFAKLETLKLNNLGFKYLKTILSGIGTQLKYIDIDNFSIEESPNTTVSFNTLGELCPKLEHLYLTMVHCDYTKSKNKLFRNLLTLSIKGVSFSDNNVLTNVLLHTCTLETFVFYQKSIKQSFPQRNAAESSLTVEKMQLLLTRGIFIHCRMFHATAIDSGQGALPLTEETLFSLLHHCSKLVKVGNLAKWNIQDIDESMETLKLIFNWSKVDKEDSREDCQWGM